MPEDGFEHATRTAVMQQPGVAVDVLDQADAPQRRRAPLLAASREIGTSVGQLVPHVMQQQVGVRPDLLGLQRLARKSGEWAFRRSVAGPVTGRALCLHEQLSAMLDAARVLETARGRREGGLVEDHVCQGFVIDLDLGIGVAAVAGGEAIFLRVGAGLAPESGRRDAVGKLICCKTMMLDNAFNAALTPLLLSMSLTRR